MTNGQRQALRANVGGPWHAGIGVRGWGWSAAIAAMLVLGGSNWTMPLSRLLAELVAAATIAAALAAGAAGERRATAPDWLCLAILGLFALHLLPLPPQLWTQLPGREGAALADRIVFGGPLWRPLSIDPEATWRSLLMLLPALAVYLAARRGDRSRLHALLRGVALAAAAAIALGLLQMALPTAEWLQFYPRGDYGRPVGFFTNRNHQATFLLCAMPLVAAWIADARSAASAPGLPRAGSATPWGLIAFVAAAAVVVLGTGSRTGAVLLPLALAGTALAWPRTSREPHRAGGVPPALARWGPLAAAGALALAAAGLLVALGDVLTSSLRRGDLAGDQRFDFWPLVASAAMHYWPVGSGIGTFLDGYEAYEPLGAVAPLYLNHAHSDFLEIFLEAGVPGLVLALVAIWELGVLCRRAWQRETAPGQTVGVRFAGVALALPVLHSLVDYPLRTVAVSTLFALGAAIVAAQTADLGRAEARNG